jgi:hypothetical protein
VIRWHRRRRGARRGRGTARCAARSDDRNGARARFRAVIRTFGHHDRRPHAAPVRDQLQAQLLVPAIAFGLMVTTFLVPAMIGIQADLGALRRRPARVPAIAPG